MTDSQFAVLCTLIFGLFYMIVGAVAMWLSVSGVHECSVSIQHTDHVAEYVTECRL